MTRADAGRTPATIVEVTGGTGGLAAAYEAVRGLADTFDVLGSVLRGWAADDAGVAADGALLASAAISPITFADAEQAVVAAATGPAGLLPLSLLWEADAEAVRVAVGGLEARDQATEAAIDQVHRRLGLLGGLALRGAAPTLIPLTIGTYAGLSPQRRAALDARLQGWAVDHPDAVQAGVNGAGGLLAGLAGVPLPLSTRQATRLLAAAYADGTHRVRPRPDLRVASGRQRPRSLAGLLQHLREVAALSPTPGSPANGTIEVQTLDPGTGHVRHVVYLPGTDDMAALPGAQDHDVRDLGTDLRSAAGVETAYQRGILDAMREAGVGAREPVLLVGHSLGGMEAAALAARDTGFTISDVVTAGAPTAQVGDYPDGVHVLSLEHRGDVVPLLDGRANPDLVNQTTVTFTDGGAATIDGAHGYDHYLAGAAAVDAAPTGPAADAAAGLRERGFLAETPEPGGVTSRIFQVERTP